MSIHLDKVSSAGINLPILRQDGALPLHRQAEQVIRKLAAHPEYAKGGLLPDEVTLAKRLGISRGTVRVAIARLVAEGQLERKAGMGTRVLQRSTESAIAAWRSFSREMARQGIQVRSFHLQLRTGPATRGVAAALRVEAGTSVQRLDRVRGWNGTPVLRSRSWFHPRIRIPASERFLRPLYVIVEEVSGLSAERASEAFGAEAATSILARDLHIKRGSPLLLRKHTVFDARGRPLEYAEVHYVSRRFMLTLDVRRGAP
jgi:GntR family transcriptional regulator